MIYNIIEVCSRTEWLGTMLLSSWRAEAEAEERG
jgi:hypothetical protein